MSRLSHTLVFAAVLCVSCAALRHDEEASQKHMPVVAGDEGQEAFDDLAAFYADPERAPKFAFATAKLTEGSPAEQQSAGRYLTALLAQSLDDESNHRVAWRRLPFWGGGAESPAREFRKKLAEHLGVNAAGDAAIEPALWLIENDPLPENADAGMKILARVESPRIEEILKGLIDPPHHVTRIAAAAIDEVRRRKLSSLSDPIRKLCTHYRRAVREAALNAAGELKIDDIPDYEPAQAFTPWLEQELKEIHALVLTPLPPEAQWKHFQITRKKYPDEEYTQELNGWLLSESDDELHILDQFSAETTLAKRETKVTDRTLQDEVEALLDARKPRENDRGAGERLSSRGSLTGQFEPSFISLRESLFAAQALAHGERAASAAVLFPRLDDTDDERWVREVTRDLIGHQYHQAMLDAFCRNRDYAVARKFALHLASPHFDGYAYQARAKQLAEQLARRADDFQTFVLPTPKKWEEMAAEMPRAQRIDFLAQRLRLLNCFQWGQPGGVNYEDTQYFEASGAGNDDPAGERTEVINPYVELHKMKLEVRDLPALVPYLADEDFMPTYSYWRDFHPSRELHQVDGIVAELLNEAAKRDLAELAAFSEMNAEEKAAHLKRINGWIATNAARSPADLLIGTLRTAKDGREFTSAAAELTQMRHAPALQEMLRRMPDFPDYRGSVAQFAYYLGPAETRELARDWANDDNAEVRFWAGMILLKAGTLRANGEPEGLAILKPLLEKDDGMHYYPRALDALLAANKPQTTEVAVAVLPKLKDDRNRFGTTPIVHRLLLRGRQEALDFLLTGLNDTTEAGRAYGSREGKSVERPQIVGDHVAGMIEDMCTDRFDYDILAPDEERAKKRQELAAWVTEQFALLKAGKPHKIKPDVGTLYFDQWRLDAP